MIRLAYILMLFFACFFLGLSIIIMFPCVFFRDIGYWLDKQAEELKNGKR
jgi:hypothetical protein